MATKNHVEPKEPAPIAIIGLSCRMPGDISSPEEFWRFCCQARSAWSEIPPTRFSSEAYYHPNPDQQGTTNAQGGHFLNDITSFDAPFFEMTAEEAMAADPQQRLMLECAYEAIENAGISKAKLAGSNVGVFAAGSFSDYEVNSFRDLQNTPRFQATGCAASFLPNRLSHFFDFTGPSLTVDTACSSSLTALHLACQSLRSGESSHALVGGCHLNLTPDYFISYSLTRLFSDSGKCYPFDHRGDSGFGRGEGVGCFMLKRLDEAIEDDDFIRAVIVNTGMNQDGHTPGIGVPCSAAQKRLMEKVYRDACIKPDDTGYVEAHGTGTKTGDPIEARALYEFFGQNRSAHNPLLIGSAKSNFGHAEGASGIVSVVKTVLMLEKGFVLPNCNFEKPRPDIPLAEWNMQVPIKLVPWPKEKVYASINNFGLGGTNAHAILRRAPNSTSSLSPAPPKKRSLGPRKKTPAPRRIYTLSGHNEEAVVKQAKSIGVYLQQHPELYDNQLMVNLAYTLCERRTALPWKAAVSARSPKDLISILTAGDIKTGRSMRRPNIGFAFTGQGAQWFAMGRELFGAYPVFVESMQRADEQLSRLQAGFCLMEELFRDELKSSLSRPAISQAASTAIQLALTDLVRSWGVVPEAVIGHSSGEIAAAYAAGIVSLEDAMTLAYGRGAAAESLRKDHSNMKGGMVAARTGFEEAQDLVDSVSSKDVFIACINSPRSVTVSGSVDGIAELQKLADSRSILTRRLKVDVAYHSQHMELVADQYRGIIKDITASDSQVAFYSSARARRLKGSDLKASYWVENYVSKVNFSEGLSSLLGEYTSPNGKIDCLVEIGPSPSLEGPIKDIVKMPETPNNVTYLASLRKDRDAVEMMHELAGSLYVQGQQLLYSKINLPQSDMPKPRLLTDLPRYSWNHTQKYWYETRISRNVNHPRFPRHDLIGMRSAEANDLQPQWRMILRADDHPWIRHHQFHGYNIYPMAGYVSMALEAASQQAILNRTEYDKFHLREVSAGKALIVPNDGAVEVMISFQPHAEGTRTLSSTWNEFQISSWTEQKGWEENCRGLISAVKSPGSNPINGETLQQGLEKASIDKLSSIISACNRHISSETMYNELTNHGIKYGPLFRALDECHVHKESAVAAALVPDTSSEMSNPSAPGIFLHPATLDICFQIVWLALGAGSNGLGKQYLASSIKELTIPKKRNIPAREKIQIYGQRSCHSISDQPVDHNIWVTSHADSHDMILQLEGLVMTPILDKEPAPSTQTPKRELCYNFNMVPAFDCLKKDQLTRQRRCIRTELEKKEKMHILELASTYYIQKAMGAVSAEEKAQFVSMYPSLSQCLDSFETNNKEAPNLDEVRDLGISGKIMCDIGDKITQILRGELDPVSAMKPQGGFETFMTSLDLKRDSSLQVVDCINILSDQNPELTILEVGTSMTPLVLPVLEQLGGGNTGKNPKFRKYVFGNSLSNLLPGLQSKLQEWGSLASVEPLDISKDLVGQGCKAKSFDVVILTSNVHYGKPSEEELRNIHGTLKEGAKLLIVEETHSLPIQLPIALVTPPSPRQGQELSELPAQESWNEILAKAGFSGTDLVVNEETSVSGQSDTLLVCTVVASESPLWGRKVSLVYNESPKWFPLAAIAERLEEITGNAVRLQTLAQAPEVDDLCIFVGEIEQPLLADISPDMLQSVQSLLTTASGVLWIVRDAYANSTNAAANMAVGLVRTVRSETGLPLATLDTDINASTPVEQIVDNIVPVFKSAFGTKSPSDPVDLEFISRGGVTSVPRIMNDPKTNEAVFKDPDQFLSAMQPLNQEDRPLQLAIQEYGLLSSLHFTDSEQLCGPLKDGYIEIDVHFVGLNFKDVMHANNQIQVDGFGIECSGVVTGIGLNVEGFRVGDKICAMSEGCLATKTRCRAASAWVVPEEMPLEVAATVPVVFCTAYFCLNYAARLMEGESVLIHAAAGGVGQAAIILAQAMGAKVFATVGSVQKKQFLVETYGIPETQIFFSRDLSFVEGVKLATGGEGVDVLINSLAGDAMRASLSCIAPFGRFVEIGKRDILSNTHLELAPFNSNISFTSVDLSVFGRSRPKLMQDLFAKIFGFFESGVAKPMIPINRFDASNVESAFQMLQSGRSIGKIVVSLLKNSEVKVSPPTRMARSLRSDASYIIVGASGGLGQNITDWLASHGARHILLVSRSGASTPAMQAQIERLREKNVNIHAVKCDISEKSQVETVLLDQPRKMPAIAGVIHSAMVLRDVIFERMSFTDYTTVIKPKVHGLCHLSDLLETIGCSLDFFIALSSIAGIVGNRGQAAYSAASTFLDAFAKSQRAHGIPFTTVDLAPLWDIGYLATDSEKRDQVRETFGSEAISESEFRKLLGAVVFSHNSPGNAPADHIITGMAVPADPKARERMEWLGDAKFSHLVRASELTASRTTAGEEQSVVAAAAEEASIIQSPGELIKRARSPAEAQSIVEKALVHRLAEVVMCPAEDIDLSKPISVAGVDSLSAIGIRKWILRELDASLSLFDITSCPSLSQLAGLCLTKSKLAKPQTHS